MPNEEKQITIVPPIKVESGKKRIAAYCRVSSQKDEQIHSLSAQIDYYENSLGKDDSCEFAGIYFDEGISGTRTRNRIGFLRLMEDCRSGKVDAIITKSVSRFGRNTVDTLVFTRELRNLGIDVYFEKENLHSCSSEGELMLTLMAAFAESEAVSMSDNIKWGKRRRYEKGLIESIAIGNLLGYSQKNGDISVNEEEAETVRLIYRMFLNGFSYADISKYLLEANVPTMRHGARWASTTIINILKNEKYCGDCKFQKTYIQDPITHKAVLNRGELPQFLVEECLPAIIDKEAWLAVQEICARHHYDRKPPCEKIPFRGMVFCGTCGKQYTQYSSCTIGRVRLDYYRCGSRKEHTAIEIPGKTFTTPHKADYNYNPTPALAEYRERYGSKLQPRPMLCTDIKFPVERTQKAFVQVWNLLISKKVRYQSTLQQTAETSDNALIRYKAREMIGLFDEVGRIADFDYSLMLKILDRVEVQPSGKLTFIFLCDIRMTL